MCHWSLVLLSPAQRDERILHKVNCSTLRPRSTKIKNSSMSCCCTQSAYGDALYHLHVLGVFNRLSMDILGAHKSVSQMLQMVSLKIWRILHPRCHGRKQSAIHTKQNHAQIGTSNNVRMLHYFIFGKDGRSRVVVWCTVSTMQHIARLGRQVCNARQSDRTSTKVKTHENCNRGEVFQWNAVQGCGN